MHTLHKVFLSAFVLGIGTPALAQPTLYGHQITASLRLDPNHSTQDPNQQTFSTTPVTIGSTIEYEYSDAANTITLDFTENQMILRDVVQPGRFSAGLRLVLLPPTATAWKLPNFVLTSSSFPAPAPSEGNLKLTYQSFSDYFQLDWDGIPSGSHDFTAIFTVPVPEPTTGLMLAAGLGYLLLLSRRRKSEAQ